MAVRAEMFAQETLSGEIIVDNFAGGGGASSGIELALGRIVNAAINHDPAAILMHKTNHPYTEHYQASVWDIDPREVCRGRPVAGAWFSPDCKHFSKAKGAALVNREIRGLAWITLRWAALVRPRVIMLENDGYFRDAVGYLKEYEEEDRNISLFDLIGCRRKSNERRNEDDPGAGRPDPGGRHRHLGL